MKPGQLLPTYTFWEIVTRWSADTGEPEDVTARALVSGIVRDGLRFQSVEPRRIAGGEALRGQPYVGYCAQPWLKPVIVRSRMLEHCLEVFRTGCAPRREVIGGEFVSKADFRTWLLATGQRLPPFWFTLEERT